MHPLILISAAIWGISEAWIFSRDKGKLDYSKDKNSRKIILLFFSTGVIMAFLLRNYAAFRIENIFVSYYPGIFLMTIGIILRIWSVVTLGKYFRTAVMVQEDHKVITHGPYKLIRHPSYTGALLTDFGFGMILGNWLSAVVLLAMTFIALRFRIIVEEKELHSSLRKDYKEYMKYTKKLIPFIY